MTALAAKIHVPRWRPIPFRGWSVRAILAGTKTQTRRLVRRDDTPIMEADAAAGRFQLGIPSNAMNVRFLDGYLKCDAPDGSFAVSSRVPCPFGVVGDRLWVRETWRTMERQEDYVDGIQFLADGAFVPIENTREAADAWVVAHDDGRHGVKYRPWMYMPRWASRLSLEIMDVRVQRLQEITEEDARAEGCTGFDPAPADQGGTIYAWKGRSSAPDPRAHFAYVWDEMHDRLPRDEVPPAAWASDPFVWAITFRRLASETPP